MKKGFTLIELLVVVLIMGILASVSLPQYFRSVEKAHSAEAVSALSAIASAQERYWMQNGTYTADLVQLDVGMPLEKLNYYTIAYTGKKTRAEKRKTIGMGGFGWYQIYLELPERPGEGERSWTCDPKNMGCNTFLPISMPGR